MKLYQKLSNVRFLSKNYSLKFLFIAFIGIHIPLIGVIIYLALSPAGSVSALSMILLTLVLTLLATGITLFVLQELLSPFNLAKRSLTEYTENNIVPDLPVHHLDEAGVLLQSVQHMITKLKRLEDERNDLLALLSHDLRTPLTQIISINDLIKNESDTERIAKYTSMIDYCVDNQLKLIENIFLVLKFKDYEIKTKDFHTVNLHGMVTNQVSVVHNKALEKNIDIENLIDTSLVINVKGMLFERVIFNLIVNAVKFSYPDNVITIDAKKQESKILITVKDNGIGFDQEIASRLFERFTSFGRKGTNGEPSEGLGLHLCKKIVEQHKGTIHAESEGKDKGSIFTIEIPA